MLSEFLNTTPSVTEPLDTIGLILRIFLILTLLAVQYFICRLIPDSVITQITIGATSFLLLFPIFYIFRIIPPGISLTWLAYSAALLLITLTIWIQTKSNNGVSFIAPIAMFFVIFLTSLFDKLNEALGSIPMSWGAFIFLLIGGLLYVKGN